MKLKQREFQRGFYNCKDRDVYVYSESGNLVGIWRTALCHGGSCDCGKVAEYGVGTSEGEEGKCAGCVERMMAGMSVKEKRKFVRLTCRKL